MTAPAQDEIMSLLRDETAYRTVAGLARSAGVSGYTVRTVLTRLEAEGRLDIRRDTWPNGYRLREAAP